MASTSSCRHFSSLLAFAASAGLAGGCVAPTNPCDPGADEDIQAQGTHIGGTVIDQDGNGIAGVAVGIVGRSETLVSGEGGVFEFTNIPPSARYELVASPTAPLVGGRVATDALVCGGVLDDVELGVVVPPQSPEIELVRASGDRRVFAAFGAVGGVDVSDVATFFDDSANSTFRTALDVVAGCGAQADNAPIAYRAQVRAPFGAWKDAVMAPFPWIDPPAAAEEVTSGDRAPEELYASRVDDVCAAALCGQFAYLEPSLLNPNARCVDVVGVVADDGSVQPLEAFGSYQVRVLSELRTPDALRARFALPERVVADAPTSAGQMSLIPGALLPVVGADGAAQAVGDISGLVTTAGGRFAILEDNTLSVMGDGKDTLDSAAQESVGLDGDVPQGAFAEDAAATAEMASSFTDGSVLPVQPVAILPAGDWVRVVRRADDGTASIAKMYVGANAEAARTGATPDDALQNADEPALRIDPLTEGAGTDVRAFTYLTRTAGSILEPGVNPKDAYVILYGSAFVLVEQGVPADMALSYFANSVPTDPVTGAMLSTGWADSSDGVQSGGLGGACNDMASPDGRPASGVGEVGLLQENVTVCYDVGAGMDQDVDLRDVEVLPDVVGNARHLITDAANDRVLLASAAALTCAGCVPGSEAPLAAQVEEVSVGREPLGMLQTRVLDCGGGSGDRTVVLVANHGSGDLSVVEEVDGTVRENGVVPLPALPTGFLDDPDGPSCEDPFVWILADDGRVIPVDMRGEPSVPLCNGAACDVGTRGRGSVGAVARSFGLGPSRSLVGGNGLLGELGFFRPKALKDAAYADNGTMVGSDAGEAPPTP